MARIACRENPEPCPQQTRATLENRPQSPGVAGAGQVH